MRTRQRHRPARRATGLQSCAASRHVLKRRVTATSQFHTVEAAGFNPYNAHNVTVGVAAS